MKNSMKIAAAVLAGSLPIGVGVIAAASSTTRTVTVSFPVGVAPKADIAFARVLGQPTNGSCDTIAKAFDLDSDVVMLAKNRDGDAICILDDASATGIRR